MPRNNLKEPRISVAEFIIRSNEALNLQVVAGEKDCDTHFLDSPRVQKLGLALSGFVDRIHSGRIQIFGNSESYYLSRLGESQVADAFKRLSPDRIACILITAGLNPPASLQDFAASLGAELVFYAHRSIWRTNDYLHAVISNKIPYQEIPVAVKKISLMNPAEKKALLVEKGIPMDGLNELFGASIFKRIVNSFR